MSEKTRKLVEAVIKNAAASKPTTDKSPRRVNEEKDFEASLSDKIEMMLDDGSIDITNLSELSSYEIDLESYGNQIIDDVLNIVNLSKKVVCGAIVEDVAFFFAMSEDSVIKALTSRRQDAGPAGE